MGRRGPPPTPTALKIASGNPGRRPFNAHEAVPQAGMPEAPDFLDELGRGYWNRLVPELAKCGLARKLDGVALGRYCDMLAQWVSARAFLSKNGMKHAVRGPATVDAKGNSKPGPIVSFRAYPEVSLVLRLQQQLITMEREFGLTPAARTRIHAEEESSISKSDQDINELRRKFFGLAGANTGA